MTALLAFLGLIALAFTLAACGDDGASTSTGSPSAAGGDFVIGFDAALTGGLAAYDTPCMQGMQFAVDEINAAGGVNGGKLVLKVVNNGSDSSTSASVASQLVSEGVNWLMTTGDPGPTLAAGTIAAAAQIPVMSTLAGSPPLREQIGEYFYFAPINPDNVQGAVQAQYAVDQGLKQAYLLVSDGSGYTMEGPAYFKEAFEARGGKVVGQTSFTIGSTSFSAQVAKIENNKPTPDVIQSFIWVPDTITFLKQLRGAGVKTQFIGPDADDFPGLVTAAGAAAEDLVYTTHYYPTPGSATEKVMNELKAKYGKKLISTNYGCVGYNIIYVIKAAYESAKSADGPALIKAMANLSSVPGATKDVTYAGLNGFAKIKVPLVQVKNGKTVLISEEYPIGEVPAWPQ